MILYKLVCENDHEFEGWFQNSAAYDKLADKKQLECPQCGTHKVTKGIMAPNIAKKGSVAKKSSSSDQEKMQTYMHHMAAKFRDYVEKNCDNVGREFPEEARKIFYGEADERPIFGEATLDEAKDLVEEGIDVCPVPDVPKLQ